MQGSCCSLRDSPLRVETRCCRSGARCLVCPPRGEGALLLPGNVPPGAGPKAGSGALERSLDAATRDAACDRWALKRSTSSRSVEPWSGKETAAESCVWWVWRTRLGGQVGECPAEGETWQQTACAPLPVSSSGVCCWLFSKPSKATSEIPLVSLRRSHLARVYRRGMYTVQGLSILSLFLHPILLFSLMFRQEEEIFASCLSIQKPLLRTPCSYCTVQHLLLIY